MQSLQNWLCQVLDLQELTRAYGEFTQYLCYGAVLQGRSTKENFQMHYMRVLPPLGLQAL